MTDETIDDLEKAKSALGDLLPILAGVATILPGVSSASPFLGLAAKLLPGLINEVETVYLALHSHSAQAATLAAQATQNPA